MDELETERKYDGYFCSVKDAVIILVLGSLCDLRNARRIYEWAAMEHVREFLPVVEALEATAIRKILGVCCVNIVVRTLNAKGDTHEKDVENSRSACGADNVNHVCGMRR